jgi:hypothetical protein
VSKFPRPPDPLAAALQLRLLHAGELLWRVYFRGGAHPIAWRDFRFFGPTPSRFDHQERPPSLQRRGIAYFASGARAPITCLAEVFQATRLVDRRAKDPWLAAFALARGLKLLDLTGPWPTVAGASMAINTGPRPRAREWSRAIYAAYPELDGLLYGSSMHANQPAIALYERALPAIPGAPSFNRALEDPTLLSRLNAACNRLGYGLV